ncbi:MAG: hypothetical protein N3A66_09920 [Planctomycetota bacterium]|nr:hypothetical protein [Planctomycetota bacterium]
MKSFAARVREICRDIARMLITKNAAYGDAALKPLGIFGSGDPEVGICARIDDKLARVKNQPGAFGEDEIMDLIGYLILLRMARKAKKEAGYVCSRK